MSAPPELSPHARPSSGPLALAIEASSDGVGLVENGRLVLANQTLLRLLGDPAAAALEDDPAPGSALHDFLSWSARAGTSDGAKARLGLGGERVDASMLPVELAGHDSRAVFASMADERCSENGVVERFLALAGSGRLVPVDRAKYRDQLRDLLAFTRPTHDLRHPVDVIPVLDAVLALARERFGARASFVSRIGRVPRVLGDESRLAHLFWNLIVNAVEAFSGKPDAEPRVIVTTRSEAERVVVEVSDTGMGVAESELERVFEPFFTTKSDALGLGLSAGREIANAFGGELSLRSRLGEGSAARLLLRAAERRVSTVPPPGSGARILIIDDEPLLGQTLKFAFSGRHDVVVAASGREALRLLGADAGYDLVLCDLMMPDLPGQRVFEVVEREHAELLPRFFFMTGGAFTDSAQEFLELHPDRRLDKPFSIADIERLLTTVR